MVAGSELTPAQIAQLVEGESEAAITRMAGDLALERLLELALVRTVPIAAPAVGTDWAIVPPAGFTWEILSAMGRFVVDATVITRNTMLRLLDQDANEIGRYPLGFNQTAGTTFRLTWATGLGAQPQGGQVAGPLPSPPLIVPANWTIGAATGNMQAGDQWSLVFLTVREWAPSRVAQRMRYLLADLDSAGGLV